jgi:molybdopterin-guanine dinucleotide biosynthesis adapter protein
VALVSPFIFQIVGYHNSGKTTLMNKLLSCLKVEGIKTVTIKHHGHGGKPAVVEETDSALHISAGAVASLVEGEGRVLFQSEQMNWSLEEKLQLMSIIHPDLILIEGHKHADYPKLVFIRKEEDLPLLGELTNIQMVLFQHHLEDLNQYPSYHRDDIKAVQWLMDYFKRKIKKA